MRLVRLLTPVTLTAAIAAVAAACGEETASSDAQVVASTTHVADLARNVAGGRAEVVGLLAPNSDPHDYEPRPSDVQAATEADLVLRSGGDLDLWMEDLVDSAGGARTVSLIESAPPLEGSDGRPHSEKTKHGEREEHSEEAKHGDGEEHSHAGVDPHWWQDPSNAIAAVEKIRDELIAIDPEGERTYRDDAARYIGRLERLDAAISACMEDIPASRRKLVTTHDSFGHFAAAYDVEVIGAAIPALTTQAQPSAGETAALVEQIEGEDVSAIFPEQGISPQLEQVIAEQTGATVGRGLWADSLGPEGSTGATYVDAMAHNAEAMAQGFTGNEAPASCEIELAAGADRS